MCLAIPMRVTSIDGTTATAEVEGIKRAARIDLLQEVSVGDYILVHAGIAIARVDGAQAEQTLRLVKELSHEVR